MRFISYFSLIALIPTVLYAAFMQLDADPTLMERYRMNISQDLSLDLRRFHALSSNDAIAVGALLETNHKLISLIIKIPNIDDFGWAAVAQGLTHNKFLEGIALLDSEMTSDAVELFSQALLLNNTVKIVCISNLKIGDSIKYLMPALGPESRLTILQIPGNNIGDEGIKLIAQALKSNSSLQLLDVGSNRIGPTGGKSIAHALTENKHLKALGFTHNFVDDEAAKAMAVALEQNTALTDLDLSYNKITRQGILSFSDTLRKNLTLFKLTLRIAPLSVEHSWVNDLLDKNKLLAELKNADSIYLFSRYPAIREFYLYAGLPNEILVLISKDYLKMLWLLGKEWLSMT